MWDWEPYTQTRSEDRPPGEILSLEDCIRGEKFVFLGAMVPEDQVDAAQILRDFDRLYALYEYSMKEAHPAPDPIRGASARLVSAATHTIASHLAVEIEVDLRHNLLQDSLIGMLKAEFPGCTVHPEWAVAEESRVDVAVDTRDGILFCEIKVAPHVRAALRQAIGQLLEYAHYPDDRRAKKWWVVSEEAPSAEDVSYLQALRVRYSLPVFYRRIDASAAVLGPET